MACLSTVWYPTPVFLAIRCACSRSAIGTRIEMARVAFRLACSMSWSNTFGSVFKIFDPAGRTRFPSLSARANSRRVCRRPCGVAYQSASSASDLNYGTSVEVRGIIPPVGGVHFVGSHSAKQLPADRENDDQIAAGCCPADQLPAILAMNGTRWNNGVGAAHDFFNFEGGDSVAQDMTHVSTVPIEALPARIDSLTQRDFLSELRPLGSGLTCENRVSRQKLTNARAYPEGQTLGQTANFRQTAPEIHVSPGFAAYRGPRVSQVQLFD